METYIIRGRQYNVTRHYGDYEPVFSISADGKGVRVIAKEEEAKRNNVVCGRKEIHRCG